MCCVEKSAWYISTERAKKSAAHTIYCVTVTGGTTRVAGVAGAGAGRSRTEQLQ
jgi:hypothetical protein